MYAVAQAPFTTFIEEPRTVEKIDDGKKAPYYVAITDPAKISAAITNGKITTNSKSTGETEEQSIDFFKNSALSFTLLSEGDNRASISSQVIHYKLFFADPGDNNTTRLYRYNIPLLVVAKLSSSYDETNSASALDVLDYEAAPLTLRLMPSWKFYSKTRSYNDELYLGIYMDARAINITDPATASQDVEMVGSGGIGFTYQCAGEAGEYNPQGGYESGKYSLSFILQGATGQKEVLGRLFNTDKDIVGSCQAYLLFKVASESKLNLKIGYQYFFQETLAGTKSTVSVALGI